MTTQPEQLLENNLIKQLKGIGYQYVEMFGEAQLITNLQEQLERHNNKKFTEKEFFQILNKLNKGNIFERAEILRQKCDYTTDDGEISYIEFINMTHWCKNEFQVTNQITMEGDYSNRYDVTILINGLPLVQIELKRRGLELKEAFNQVNRYERHSYGAGHGLFNYVQLFVISNGVNTKYFCNNTIKKRSFEQTFFWGDVHNKPIKQLEKFAELFLEPCHIAKMITRYIVLNQTSRMLMVMRSYQYYAVEAMVERVKNSTKNGYIWHTTGSGKTLTSFKASQILTNLPEVYKVVFVVDRKDLDYQTTKEFQAFSDDSVDSTNNTKKLVEKFNDPSTKLIVTTIQKLNTAITKDRHLKTMNNSKDERVVFIFDECHRSQFGETHKQIVKYFTNAQLFGFTGTPIFVENAATLKGIKKTTVDLFEECLHKYIITDAIRDQNVLKFSVEYISTFKQKEIIPDIKVQGIDEPEVLNAPERIEKVVEYIIENHDRKTHAKRYTAMMCVSSIDTLIAYYDFFQAKKEEGLHNLRIATIFSYAPNQYDKDVNTYHFDNDEDNFLEEEKPTYNTEHHRDKLQAYIGHYNKEYNTNYTTKDSQSFYNYYNNLSKRVRNREVDVLLVVNMFLTGFDSKPLNTLYVDKNLRYHGLIQAFSRTNRILDDKKSQGNIVCFRNLKPATDEAITLFSNPGAQEQIILEPYEQYVDKFNAAYIKLLGIASTPSKVDDLIDEKEELEFVKAFRELMRLNNVLTTFSDFTQDDLSVSEAVFVDYRSKYLDIREKVKQEQAKEKVSILDDIDFELELIHRDNINVAYILGLLANISGDGDKEKQIKSIIDLVSGDSELRSKKKLIEEFVNQNRLRISDLDNIEEEFDAFMEQQKEKAFQTFATEEHLDSKQLQDLVGNYLFSGIQPTKKEIEQALLKRPSLSERSSTMTRIKDKILDFIETYVHGVK